MSTGPLGFIGSAAGTSMAQAKGSEVGRAQQEATNQARKVESTQKADDAAGIGQTDQDQEASDRDADGRRIWEVGPDGKRRLKPPLPPSEEDLLRQSKDATGQTGRQLDLSG
jgi:hypothetical protein